MVDLKSNIRLFIRFFSCFGLVQVRYGSDGQLEVLRNSKFIIPVLLLIYWINAVAIFFFERISTDKISTVSNGIQLILNCIMISVLMVVPIKYAQLASRSIAKIQDLDAEFEKAGIVVDYKKLQRKFWGIISFFVMFLTYVVSYDGFVTYKNGFTSFKYWFVTILPSFFMVLILSQAICAVALVSSFYKTVNKAIVQQIRYEKDVPKFNSNSDKLKGRVSLTVSGHNQAPFFPKVFYILGDLHEICLKLENYFGPVFLVTFTTIFVVTSIQLYYCYQIFQIQDEERGFSYWSLAQCLNVVATNIILVVTVTALCQTITNQSKKAGHYTYKLQTVGSKLLTAKEIQMMLQEAQFLNNSSVVRFSAMNFFNLDYSMLCGMVGAITTYLIIYIQFSNVYQISAGDKMTVRSIAPQFGK